MTNPVGKPQAVEEVLQHYSKRVHYAQLRNIIFVIAAEYLFDLLFSVIDEPGCFFVSVAGGMVVSGILIYALPALAGADSIWLAMPITELLVAIIVIILIIRYTSNE